MTKQKLTNRLINALIGNYECTFSDEEKAFIEKLAIGTMTHFEEKKLFYLLVNTETNISDKWKANIKSLLAYLAFDFDGSLLMQKLDSSNKFNYTFYQQLVYSKLNEHNLILIAGTGFGKTMLFSNYFVENYQKQGGKWVICVPTELLEQQLITTLQAKHKKLKAKIGSNIFKNDLLVLTPEKLFLAAKLKMQITAMLVDEAHNLLAKDIDRMVFAQKEILKVVGKIKHVYFTTPFMDQENIRVFKEIFATLDLKHIVIARSADKRNLVLQQNQHSFLSPQNETYIPKHRNEYDAPVLIYENAKRRCLMLANEEFEKNQAQKELKYNPELNRILSKWDLVKFKAKYLPLKLARHGVGYIHGDMPIVVKNMVVDLVKRGYIKKVFATHAILNGIDLPFQHLIVNETKIFKTTMTTADFNNLRGRVSRWNDAKRGSGLGLAIIKDSEPNQVWFLKNKAKLNEKTGVPKIVEDNMTLFINKSYQQFKIKKQKVYLVDPRVDPQTTKVVRENDFKELENWKELVFYRKNNDKKKLEKFIENLFKLYQLGQYDQKYQSIISKRGNLKTVTNAVKNYCWASFSVDNAIQKYIHSQLMKTKEHDELWWTQTFEDALMKIKRYGKYFFTMFLGHYISLKNPRNFVEYLAFGTFDNNLIAAIEKTKNRDKWIGMVNNEQKDDEQNGKRFDKKWRDCRTLVRGRTLKTNYPFINNLVKHIKAKK